MHTRVKRIVDAHIHWWDVGTNPWYDYIRSVGEATGTDLHSNYLPNDYRRSIGDAPVTSVVHVSAVAGTRRYVEELRWVDKCAANSGFAVHCVGSVDPALDPAAIRSDLDAQFKFGRLRGIRVLEGLDPDGEAANVLADWLVRRDLVLDLVARPDTLDRWTSFITQRPDLRVVLEHSGWPYGTDDDCFQAWERSITRFASATNAAVKLSGLPMVTFEISDSSMRRWIECCFESFGWDRVMFASNFPVDGLLGSYAGLLKVFDSVLGSATDQQAQQFFAENAERVYQIPAG